MKSHRRAGAVANGCFDRREHPPRATGRGEKGRRFSALHVLLPVVESGREDLGFGAIARQIRGITGRRLVPLYPCGWRRPSLMPAINDYARRRSGRPSRESGSGLSGIEWSPRLACSSAALAAAPMIPEQPAACPGLGPASRTSRPCRLCRGGPFSLRGGKLRRYHPAYSSAAIRSVRALTNITPRQNAHQHQRLSRSRRAVNSL